jgi:hypothetical protein
MQNVAVAAGAEDLPLLRRAGSRIISQVHPFRPVEKGFGEACSRRMLLRKGSFNLDVRRTFTWTRELEVIHTFTATA